MALIVVFYVFRLFCAFASSPSIHLINAYVMNGALVVTVSNTGSINREIVRVEAGRVQSAFC